MTPETKLLLVGCGKMGGALLQNVAGKITTCVVEPLSAPPHLNTLSRVTFVKAPDKINSDFEPDIILFALKPQHMANALPAYAHYASSVFLSIAAGLTLASVEKALGSKPAVVRSMPNLPASIGQGMSVATANQNVTNTQRQLCDELLRAIGEVAWVEDEKVMDAVTALSGSGPAYIFALCEAMAKAGVSLGLSPSLAAKLARQTVIGSGTLLSQSAESAETLRVAVTSLGGTTEAALKALFEDNGLQALILKAMTAAKQRAGELATLA